MSHHGLPPSFSTPSLPLDFDLQKRVYALRPLPAPPPLSQQKIKRKPLRPNARLVGQAARLPMAGPKQDAAQSQEHPPLQTQGSTLNTSIEFGGILLSPPPKSPFRFATRSTPSTPTPTAAQRRRSSRKVHQLTGTDIDVFDDSPWKYGHFQMDAVSDSSSVYSQDSTNNASTMKSWHTSTDEPPALDHDQDGKSSRVDSWEPKSPPAWSPGATSLEPSPSLRRKPRTHRKSRDKHVLDNYHRIVTDLASPGRSSIPDLLTAIPPSAEADGGKLRAVTPLHGPASFESATGMPANFAEILNHPRQAPRPPLRPVGRPKPGQPDERMGSFFDFDSDSDEGSEADGLFSTSGRGRDSFLGMLLGRGGGGAEDGHRSRSVSTGAGRPSSELETGALSDSAGRGGEASGAAKGGRRERFKELVEWKKKDEEDVLEERRRKRQAMKQNITIQGGRRI